MNSEQRSWWRSRSGLVFLGFAAIAGFFLWEEHKAHILGALPYALLLLCRSCIYFTAGMEITAMRIGTATEESENDQRTCLWITPAFFPRLRAPRRRQEA